MNLGRAIKTYLYEVFRPHGRKEYTELFTRGGDKEGITPRPWLYARVWLLFLALFAISVFGFSVSKLDTSSVIFLGATFGNIGLVVLFYELYPKRDLSVITPLAVLFVGGVISIGFSQFFYSIAIYSRPYVSQLWTAFVEETSKAVTTIIIIALLKKRSPYFCFLIGAAVGSGFSMFEDMWYIYTDAVSTRYTFYIYDAVLEGFVRSFGAPFSHAAWAAAFGWAISFEKCWKNFRPYAVFAGNFVLHFFVNFPLIPWLAGWRGYPISIATGIIAVGFEIYLIVKYRSPAAEEKPQKTQLTPEYASITINGEKKGGRFGYAFKANVVAAVAVGLASLLILAIAFLYRGPVYSTTLHFSDFESVKAFAQNGEIFEPDFEREEILYGTAEETDLNNFSVTYSEGEITEVVQREQYGDYFYRFSYGYRISVTVDDHDGKMAERKEWTLLTVQLEYGERIVACSYVAFEDEFYPLFIVNDAVISVRMRVDGTAYATVSAYYYENELLSQVLFGFLCATIVAGTTAYIILRLKSRRDENAGL